MILPFKSFNKNLPDNANITIEEAQKIFFLMWYHKLDAKTKEVIDDTIAMMLDEKLEVDEIDLTLMCNTITAELKLAEEQLS